MYGFPDSAILGTAKRIGRAVRGTDLPKDRKGRPIPEQYATDALLGWLGRQIDKVNLSYKVEQEKEAIKLARQEYFERYGHYPAGDPR